MDLLGFLFDFLGTIGLPLSWTFLLVREVDIDFIVCSLSLWKRLEKLSRLRLLVASLIGDLKLDLGECDWDSSSDANLAFSVIRFLFIIILRSWWNFPSDKLVFLIKERNSSLYDLTGLQGFCQLDLEGIEGDDPATPDLVNWVVDYLTNTCARTDLDETGLLFWIFFSHQFGLILELLTFLLVE